MRFIPLVALMLFISCNEEESNMGRMELLGHIKSLEDDVEVMIPPDLKNPLVNCYEFLPPCKLGYKVKIKGLEVSALYYEDQSNAIKSAKTIRGYVFRNWAFDQVRTEPILERFFENKLKAKAMFEKE